ncbi:MAG TPA: prepilin-type N-terminal cleavage/methylation domain-containing protein [Solirubrobacteraceae bacterium]|jgi:prepilin-type N-terminal cleavage/methylation domain-containing protein|nr:prepilin-type N-terminal cleavage/methylation domain-containing protein [Solirubrobacteraceae bacterium]
MTKPLTFRSAWTFRGAASRGAAPSRKPRRERLADQSGYTLIELVVAMALLTVIVVALLNPLLAAQRNQIRDANYAAAQQQSRAGLDSMVAQIRQATLILASGSNFVEMNVSLEGTSLLVQYECDIAQPGTTYRECLRVQAPIGGTLPSLSTGKVVVVNLQNGTSTNPVFSWGPDPNAPYYMTATIQVPSSGGNKIGLAHSLVFSDGALMRNLNVGN